MDAIDLLVDAVGRARSDATRAVDGLDVAALHHRPDGAANPVAWLVWHLARVQDDHVADLAGDDQVWTGGGWARRFDLPLADDDIGFGHTDAQVDTVRVTDPGLLTGYLDAVCDRTVDYLRTLSATDLDEVVDPTWDPPVTRGVRLVSVIDDDIQHAGQAAFAAGIARRATGGHPAG